MHAFCTILYSNKHIFRIAEKIVTSDHPPPWEEESNHYQDLKNHSTMTTKDNNAAVKEALAEAKNKLKDAAYGEERAEEKLNEYEPATADNLHVGDSVYFATLESVGQVLSVNAGKGEAEVLCGSIKTRCKISALQKVNISADRQNKREVRIRKSGDFAPSKPELEINLLGMTVPEALSEVDNFIDRAVLNNLEEIKVIHGVGTGKLREAISAHLRRHKNVSSFRLGKYGEGETGVTIITLK